MTSWKIFLNITLKKIGEPDQIERAFYKMENGYFRPQNCDFETNKSIRFAMQRRLLMRKFEVHLWLIQDSDHLKNCFVSIEILKIHFHVQISRLKFWFIDKTIFIL